MKSAKKTSIFSFKTTIAVAVASSLAFVLFGPNADIVAYDSFEPSGPVRPEGRVVSEAKWTRRDVYFGTVGDDNLHGWFYLPIAAATSSGAKYPLVVMGSGLVSSSV